MACLLCRKTYTQEVFKCVLKTSPHMCLCKKDDPLIPEQQLMLYQPLLICLENQLRASSALGNFSPIIGSFYHFKWIFKGLHY